MSLDEFFPPAEIALRLEPEELAIPLLKCLVDRERNQGDVSLNLGNFVRNEEFDKYGGDKADDIRKAITEAWVWLERELMIAPNFRTSPGWVYVTKRGKELAAQNDIQRYIKSSVIRAESLDSILASKVHPLFIRGDYDTAVFQAFKEVEIRVRTVSYLPQELIGTELMRKAFHPDDGKLTDVTRPKPEREATSHLFAGAIGLFKNPSSHRDVNWEDPIECAELIYLADHLLRTVDKRGKEIQGS